MKVLIVGGTGALGGHCAIHLASKGHDVSIGGRKPAHAATPMAGMPFLQGDYINGDFTPERLKAFDWVVFAAGNDPRHVPRDADFGEFLFRANHVGVPGFFAACREGGVKRAIQLGSYYHQAAPQLLDGNGYIRSRKAACEGARAQARPGFDVISVNAPFMVGSVPGLPSAIFEPYTHWAEGKIPIPHFGPAGGTNFMSFQSLSEAIDGALNRGEAGKAYLVGDENLSFTAYFQLFFDAVSTDVKLEERDIEHPLLPDVAIPQGRGNWVSFEPDPGDVELLGYRRRDVRNAVAEVVAQFRA
ncbi:MAG: NAD(P)-dependent oxidoreductase [Sphingomonadales bacterium]|jgi:nucleoside-diphosphate-sugar epimerase|nr:NAD(P)-dependent oxidoreductase [Sphingomonadales bacterium]